MKRAAFLITLILTIAVTAHAAKAEPASCAALAGMANRDVDASQVLQACIDATPVGGALALRPGRYVVGAPIALSRAISLSTVHAGRSEWRCGTQQKLRCATLVVHIRPSVSTKLVMPFDVEADDVHIDHVIFSGMRATDPVSSTILCLSATQRALGGGVRVNGSNIVISDDVFRDFSCYSSLEIDGGRNILISKNQFLNNGDHTSRMMWADGLTIHEGLSFIVKNNVFTNNTDVQLIIGGCIDCNIAENNMNHNRSAAGGSFAELMLQAWPKATSGRFDGSQVSDNQIDCGPARRCGFGIMIGSAPWYAAPASGGAVIGNRVANAELGIDVDDLSGPMEIIDNRVSGGIGRVHGACGDRQITAGINISPTSRRFLSTKDTSDPAMKLASSGTYAGCILNYPVI